MELFICLPSSFPVPQAPPEYLPPFFSHSLHDLLSLKGYRLEYFPSSIRLFIARGSLVFSRPLPASHSTFLLPPHLPFARARFSPHITFIPSRRIPLSSCLTSTPRKQGNYYPCGILFLFFFSDPISNNRAWRVEKLNGSKCERVISCLLA